MQLTAELSLYPLREGYIDIIKTFIERLRTEDGITVISNAMSTQVQGDHEQVLALVGRELQHSYERYGRQVLVCKLIPGDLQLK